MANQKEESTSLQLIKREVNVTYVTLIYTYGSFPCNCSLMDCKNILVLQLSPMDYNLCSILSYLETIQIMCSELSVGTF